MKGRQRVSGSMKWEGGRMGEGRDEWMEEERKKEREGWREGGWKKCGRE